MFKQQIPHELQSEMVGSCWGVLGLVFMAAEKISLAWQVVV